jgi:hypothetical protein
MLDARARAALLAAEQTSSAQERATLIARVHKLARLLEKERNGWAGALASLARAGAQRLGGDAAQAAVWYARAEGALEAAELHTHAAAARRRRGELLGGDEGAALVNGVDQQLSSSGVRNPPRFVDMLAPGGGRK